MEMARSARANRNFLVGLVIVFVAFSIPYSMKVLKPRNGDFNQSAILRWADQIQAMEEGENIHRTRNYPNPPIMPILLWPISELAQHSPLAAALVWYYLKVFMAIVCFGMVFRMIEDSGIHFPIWAKALAVGLSLRPILGDLSHGNINIFILLLVVSSLYSFHRGRDVLAGILLALAITAKVTPALFVGYFLWKQGWKVLAGTAIGLLLFFEIIPGCILGFEANHNAVFAWYEGMIKPFLIGGVVTPEYANQSLPGILARLLTHAPSASIYVNDIYTPTEYNNLMNLDPAIVKRIVQGCMAIFALVVIWRCRTPIRPRSGATDRAAIVAIRKDWRLVAEFGLITLGMLAFSERTWKHHCVTLMIPIAVLCFALREKPRLLPIICLTIAMIAITSTATGGLLDDLGRASQVYGAYLPAYLALGAGCVWLMGRPAKLATVEALKIENRAA